jgi:RimJ/RimL family protein N-acetyltransferase
VKVIIRSLREADANKSFQWRNNPQIWRFTGSTPSKYITVETEREWLRQALSKSDEIRMAICVGENQVYAGNVQLTRITKNDAEFHIFIGELDLQGKGIGGQATQLMLDYGHKVLGLKSVYLRVHPANSSAIRTYIKCGFELLNSSGEVLTYVKDFTK